ncbi:MAG: hypothetical protein VYE16_04180, partial [Cyanobacteriota bacterium]|nr:hypothetical protein [Cyanobacteriota bacterium]
YIPKLRQRLLSTTVFSKTYPGNDVIVGTPCWKIAANPKDPTETAIDVFINNSNNLPMSTGYRYASVVKAAEALQAQVTAICRRNVNLSEAEKELLRWHTRLGHVNLRTVQFLMRMGVLVGSQRGRALHTTASKLTHRPQCASCLFGKQTQKSVPGKQSSIIRDRVGVLSGGKNHPGDLVHMDHFICATRGRKFTGFGVRHPRSGRSLSNSFCGGLLFVDSSSGYMDVRFQTCLDTTETLEGVQAFEEAAKDSGVFVKEYLSDNGSCFTSKQFKEHIAATGQHQRLSGPGSHHQNGKAERAIRTIITAARTMMLHCACHWPAVADAQVWPLAVAYAVWLYNHLPNRETGQSPIDLWTHTHFP